MAPPSTDMVNRARSKHRKQRSRPKQCGYCSYRGERNRAIERYIKSCQADLPPIPCPVCPVTFAGDRGDNLQRHLQFQYYLTKAMMKQLGYVKKCYDIHTRP
jgi:hypothetical protein